MMSRCWVRQSWTPPHQTDMEQIGGAQGLLVAKVRTNITFVQSSATFVGFVFILLL